MIIWETATLTEIGRHRLHHASVVAVAVSPSDALVVSAGGADADFVVWDLADSKSPLCGRQCSNTEVSIFFFLLRSMSMRLSNIILLVK